MTTSLAQAGGTLAEKKVRNASAIRTGRLDFKKLYISEAI